MNVGDYVRTINGKIWVIKSQKAISGHKKDIINYSPNVIDLIEIGDYVNGKYINEIDIHRKLIYSYERDDYYIFKERDIKSIVTKEQFESVEYRIGE